MLNGGICARHILLADAAWKVCGVVLDVGAQVEVLVDCAVGRVDCGNVRDVGDLHHTYAHTQRDRVMHTYKVMRVHTGQGWADKSSNTTYHVCMYVHTCLTHMCACAALLRTLPKVMALSISLALIIFCAPTESPYTSTMLQHVLNVLARKLHTSTMRPNMGSLWPAGMLVLV